jgi:NAD(P)-dependent dehydrogenase (short-subunit alcohol dehydrogenase family)
VAARAVDGHGGVDVLINAPSPPAARARADEPGAGDLALRAIEAGYFAPVRLILALVPAMRLNNRGHVINVCLAAGGAREHGCAAQIGASAALDSFGRCLAPELDDARIPITTVHVPLDAGPDDVDAVCDALVHRPKRVGTAWGTRDPITALAPVLTGR